MIVQDYRSDAGSRLSFEIFEMASPESAYGIYTFKTSRNGEPVSLGDECQLSDYYLNLRKGPYLVTITGLDLTVDAKESILLLARTIEPRIGPAAARPGLVSHLPAEGLLSQSIKYFKGPLALFNSYPFFQGDVFAFSAGVKGEYEPGYSLYILEYREAIDARSRFAHAGQSFEKSERYRGFSKRGGIYLLKDDRDSRIFAAMTGRYILLLIGPEDEPGARKIFSVVSEKLPDS